MRTPARFPHLKENQYAVLICERSTGIIWSKKYARAQLDEDAYFVFNAIEMARDFVTRTVAERPILECTIFDSMGQLLEQHRATDARWAEAVILQKKARPWWKRLIGL